MDVAHMLTMELCMLLLLVRTCQSYFFAGMW
jgi:hypothetical protein